MEINTEKKICGHRKQHKDSSKSHYEFGHLNGRKHQNCFSENSDWEKLLQRRRKLQLNLFCPSVHQELLPKHAQVGVAAINWHDKMESLIYQVSGQWYMPWQCFFHHFYNWNCLEVFITLEVEWKGSDHLWIRWASFFVLAHRYKMNLHRDILQTMLSFITSFSPPLQTILPLAISPEEGGTMYSSLTFLQGR